MEQFGAAFDRSSVNQAGRDLYLNASPVVGPGLASLAVPEEVTHTVRGRAGLLDLLSGAAGQVVVLHGNGGHGKTTAAAQFAQHSAAEVWWVDASSATSLVEGLREVALRAGADERAVKDAWAGASSAPEVLWNALDNRSRSWLLVLDNADDPGVLASGGRVAAGRGWLRTPKAIGTVLVTSRDGRRSQWGDRAVLLPVDVLGVEDAAAMLLELAPGAGDQAGARDLAERLGGLPLALRLAGRYLRSTSDAVRLPGAVLPRTFAEYDSALADHPDADDRESLSRTWELSLDLLAKRGRPLTRPLMRLLSTFAQAPIPVELLDAAVLAESDRFRGITVQELSVLVDDLRGLGLVEHREHRLVLHPLVREANLRQADGFDDLRTELLVALVKRLPHEDTSTWPLWHGLRPHTIEIGGTSTKAFFLHFAFAGFCVQAGLFIEAEALFRRSLACSVALLGESHGRTVYLRVMLASLLGLLGRQDAELAEYRAVLMLQERTLGADHEETRQTRGTVAELTSGRAETRSEVPLPDKTEVELRELLERKRATLGEHHYDVLSTRAQLVIVLGLTGRMETMERELRELLPLTERAYGRANPFTASVRKLLDEAVKYRTANPPP